MAIFAGVGVLVVAMLTSARVMRQLKALRRAQLQLTDQRVKQANEALTAIRLIQLNSWEGVVGARIDAVRRQELRLIRSQARLQTGDD